MRERPHITPPTAPNRPTWREFAQLINEDRMTNRGWGRGWLDSGFHALFVLRLGHFALGIPNPVVRKPLTVVYQLLRRRVRNKLGIEIHNRMTVGRRVRIVHQGAIVMHECSVIGDDCTIRQAVTLGGAGDGWSPENRPILGKDVHVGSGAVIIGNVHVGDGARIGPNAVVMTDVPAGAIVVASRSRVIVR